MTPELLTRSLVLAGFLPGEHYELAIKPQGGAFRGRHFDSVASGLVWLNAQPPGDRYFGLNPIRPDAAFPPGRAQDSDVQLVRVLLIDVDPGDPPSPKRPGGSPDDPQNVKPEKRQAARDTAFKILEHLARKLGEKVTWIDSGRGQHLWWHHAPAPLGDPGLADRGKLLNALAKRFSRAGLCHVDVRCANPSRLARLPGTVNLKTGDLAKIVEGDGW